jgi:serine/threonine-protein phosphatase 2A regulatory subunit A
MDRLVQDEIPNIRFNVAKSYAVLITTLLKLPDNGTVKQAEESGTPPSPHGKRIIEEKILPNLERLQQDEDVDVIYFAKTAAQIAEEG